MRISTALLQPLHKTALCNTRVLLLLDVMHSADFEARGLESCMGMGMRFNRGNTAVMELDFMTDTAVIAGMGTTVTVVPR